MEASYNDIVQWEFKELVSVFGGTEQNTRKLQVKTRSELAKLFKEDEFNSASRLQFVELYMPKKDAPAVLIKTAQASAKVNSRMD
jgi:pyruvate decarboxylase